VIILQGYLQQISNTRRNEICKKKLPYTIHNDGLTHKTEIPTPKNKATSHNPMPPTFYSIIPFPELSAATL
jgi:hypothetical protein